MSDKDIDKMADDIMKEMSIPETKNLKDNEKQNKQKETEDLIKEICERTGGNCNPEEPKDDPCEQGQPQQ